MAARGGVTFVVPVHDGARWLEAVLAGIAAQADGRPVEIVAVDDGSTDGSVRILRDHARRGRLRVVTAAGRGAAAAVNLGVAHATHPVICQVDQDVVLLPGWMARLTAELAAPDVAAVQGYYVTPPGGSLWARVMGLDLEARYGRIRGTTVDHVCTGNTAYRAEALREVGGLDESLGYGYDNDLSYRLGAAGYRLVLCRDARAIHHWRETAAGYLAQQYGYAYGRLDLVAKHPGRLTGDQVAGVAMGLHVAGLPLALASLGAAGLAAPLGGPAAALTGAGLATLALLGLERAIAGVRAARRSGDPAGLAFAPVHLCRDLAWTLALLRWTGRRLRRRPPRPTDSMARRAPAAPAAPTGS